MSIALRLDDKLVREAEAEGYLSKRTAPKQVEYWAEIGKAVSHMVAPGDLLALMQGLAQLRIEPPPSQPLDPDAVFATVERERESGQLGAAISRAPVRYAASRTHPGLLDRVHADGTREPGRFRDGQFIPAQ